MTTEIAMRRSGSGYRADNLAELARKIELVSIPEPNSGCWIWLGQSSKGYGYVRFRGKSEIASRASFMAFRGDPKDMDVCHRCDMPLCVNPDHLFLGTALDNIVDSIRKGRWRRLTVNQIRDIAKSRETGVSLARRYDVSDALISMIKNGKYTRHQWSI